MRWERLALALALALGLAIWAVDAVLDYLVFFPGRPFWCSLLAYEYPHEAYFRGVIVVAFLAFGLIASRMTARRRRAEQALAEAQQGLEHQVRTRTAQLQAANEQLQRHRDHLEEEVAARTAGLAAANRNLQQEKQFTEAVTESLPGLFYVFEVDGRLLQWNRNMEELSGYSREEIARMTPLDFFAPEDAPRTAEAIRRTLETGTGSLENDFHCKDGRKVPHYFTGVQIEIGGRPHVVGVGIDISGRKRAERRIEHLNRLKETLLGPGSRDEHLQRVADAAVEILEVNCCGVWILEPGDLCRSGCVYAPESEKPPSCQVSQRCFHRVAYCQQDMEADGRQFIRVPPDCPPIGAFAADRGPGLIINDLQNHPQLPHRQWAAERGLVAFASCRVMATDGSLIGTLAVFSKRPITSDDYGLLETLAGTTAQVIHSAEAEEALRQQRDRAQNYLDIARVILLVIGADQRVQMINRLGCAILKRSEAELLGQNWFDLCIPEEHQEEVRTVFSQLIAGEARLAEYHENPVLTKQGERRLIAWHNTILRDRQGNIIGTLSSGEDITERKLAEAERERLIAQLEAQNAELERFAYTVSHDLKSPLITMKGYLGLLKDDIEAADHEAVEDDMTRIGGAVDKMGRLLEDLLELSRIGRVVNPSEPVSLEQLAREAVQLVQGRITEGNIQVEIHPGLPTVFGDRARLLEVLQNLIDNAAKYMGDQSHPRIEIGAHTMAGETVCYVRDNGTGVEPRFHEKIFGLFDQLDPKSEGSGIGLALVRRIVEVHGGRLWVESQGRGTGATFCFTIASQPNEDHGPGGPAVGQHRSK